MIYKLFTSEVTANVILFAHNKQTGESYGKRFEKIGTCLEYIVENAIPVTIGDCKVNEDAFRVM